MTLNQALARIKSADSNTGKKAHCLVCGFQPLHLRTLLHAHLTDRAPGTYPDILTGQYGDLHGNITRATESPAIAAALVVEWSDIDPRLGLRSTGGWSQQSIDSLLSGFESSCQRLESAIETLAAKMPVAVAGPGLPLPPLGNTIRSQSSSLELDLRQKLAAFLLRLSGIDGVRVVDSGYLQQLVPEHLRLDAKLELIAGFPYTVPYADALASCFAGVLYQPAPKKGLITDLDDTLWSGLVGEIGPDAVGWQQESHAQTHGLYQQMLGLLSDRGVLLAACSKNELATVEQALGRSDFLFDTRSLFPILSSWGAKSRAVDEILRTWNISADSVVFVDDNPMELAEVKQAHPGIACLQFFPKDAAKVWALLNELRDLFGKPRMAEEDALRSASIRAAAAMREAPEQLDSLDFLTGLEGEVTVDFSPDASDARPLDLINKTNQFNLNGLRIAEGEWKQILRAPGSIVATVSYRDKFGPLGKIAVLAGRREQNRVTVSHWVMSCRAFSRRIEYHTLGALFRHSGAEEIDFMFQTTGRNQPLQEFIAAIGASHSIGPRLSLARFRDCCGSLPHRECLK